MFENMYKKGCTISYMAEMLNIGRHVVQRLLKENNVDLGYYKIISEIVEHPDVFEKIDTPEKAYWLGWMATDGYVILYKKECKNEIREYKRIAIHIQNRDIEILERFSDFVGYDKSNIKTYTSKDGFVESYVNFKSYKMFDDLSKYGVLPNKLETQVLPVVDDNLMPYLIRGVFDGNGSFNTKFRQVLIYGTENLCNQIADYLFDNDIVKTKHIEKRKGCYMYGIYANQFVKNFFEYIYQNPLDFKLTRKYEKYVMGISR